MLATALGLLPTQIINVYLGSTLRSMQDVLTDDNTATTGYIVFTVQVSCLCFVKRCKELINLVTLGSDKHWPDDLRCTSSPTRVTEDNASDHEQSAQN